MTGTSTMDEPAEHSLGDSAMRYAERGFRVLPVHGLTSRNGILACDCTLGAACSSPGKHPRIRQWQNEATAEGATVRRWWREAPNTNIGLLCGVDFDVLDVDGDEGLAALVAATSPEVSRSDVEGLATVMTGRGFHAYIQPIGISRARLCSPKVQVQSKNHFVVAPPSLHISGTRYRATPRGLDPATAIAPAPEWLDRLIRSDAGQTARSIESGYDDAVPELLRYPVTAAYARAAVANASSRIAQTPEGARNDTLNREAFTVSRFVWSGLLSAEEVIGPLLDAGLAAGLLEREVEATVLGALRASHSAQGDAQ